MIKRDSYNRSSIDSFILIKDKLLDTSAKDLTRFVQWKRLDGLSKNNNDLYPVAITGKGPPIILLHGFDSCFLEYRRLVPYLKKSNTLIIPDLYGFGFTPRHSDSKYGIDMILFHLNKVMDLLSEFNEFGIIGASMGGGIGIELAKRNNSRIKKLLLLSPAGIIGKTKKVPRPFDKLGVLFLKNKLVRDYLCANAFANSSKSVGEKEKQIASIHLHVPGWGESLAAFARSGGIANCGSPNSNQLLKVLWGAKDRILTKKEREASKNLLNCCHEELEECGHLPHLDKPELVYKAWLKNN